MIVAAMYSLLCTLVAGMGRLASRPHRGSQPAPRRGHAGVTPGLQRAWPGVVVGGLRCGPDSRKPFRHSPRWPSKTLYRLDLERLLINWSEVRILPGEPQKTTVKAVAFSFFGIWRCRVELAMGRSGATPGPQRPSPSVGLRGSWWCSGTTVIGGRQTFRSVAASVASGR